MIRIVADTSGPDQGLAVYRVSPRLLVVEAEDGTVVERSLKERHDGGYRLSADVRSPER